MFAENKYTRWYFKIVDAARLSPREGYVEEHHVIPQSMGGSDAAENIVRLSAREHFICHLLLVKMVEGKALMQMRKALRYMMCVPKKMQGLRWIPTGRTVEIARKEAALANKGNKEIAAKISVAMTGRTLSEEHKQKISESNKGKGRAQASIIAQRGQPKSEAAKEKMRLAWVGRRIRKAAGLEVRKPMSEQAKLNISVSKKGKPASEEQKLKNGLAHKALWKTPEHRQKVLSAQQKARALNRAY